MKVSCVNANAFISLLRGETVVKSVRLVLGHREVHLGLPDGHFLTCKFASDQATREFYGKVLGICKSKIVNAPPAPEESKIVNTPDPEQAKIVETPEPGQVRPPIVLCYKRFIRMCGRVVPIPPGSNLFAFTVRTIKTDVVGKRVLVVTFKTRDNDDVCVSYELQAEVDQKSPYAIWLAELYASVAAIGFEESEMRREW